MVEESNIRRANSASIPCKSHKVMFLSTTSPSIWWNMGEWVASSSERNTLPGDSILMGGFSCSITRICPAEVCVRKSSLSAM